MASKKLEELLVLINSSTTELRKELNKGTGDVKKFQKSVDKQLASVDNRFASLGKTLRNTLAIIGIGFGVRELIEFTRGAVALGASIDDAANNAGIGAERLQRLQFAFEQNGVEAREFDRSMQSLNRRLGVFIQTGGGPAAVAIKRLGLETDITSGKIRTSEQLFDSVVQRLEGVSTVAEKAAIASGLFGDDAGPKLVKALSLGVKGLKEYEDAAQGVLSDEQVAKAAAIDDAFNRLARTIGVTLKGAVVSTAASMAQFFGATSVFTSLSEIEEQIAKLEKTAKVFRDQLAQGFIPQGGSGAQQLAEIEQQLDALYKQLVRLSDASVDIDVGTSGDQFPIKDIAGPTGEGGFPTVFAGPNLFPSREELAEVQEKLLDLEEQALRSQGRMAEAIRMAADQQIAEWQRVAEETPAFADEAARAIEFINQKAAEDIKTALEKANPAIEQFANSFAASFESRGIDALLSGDISEAIRGMAKDIAELILRLVVLKPLAESLGGIFGGGLGSLFGGGGTSLPVPSFAGGGRPPMDRPSNVHEGELFVPDVPGRIFNATQLKRMSEGGVVINQQNNTQAGLPPQWQAQMAVATKIAAVAAREAVAKELGGRR